MVIDIHTHAFSDNIAGRALDSLASKVAHIVKPHCGATIGELAAHMERSGVNRFVLQPVATKESQMDPINNWAQSVQTEHIQSFAALYPHITQYKEAISNIASMGFKGVKLHPEYQDFQVDALHMLRLYNALFEKGLAVMMHTGVDHGMPAPYKSSPKQLKNVVRNLQGGIFIAAHMGGHAMWEQVEAHLLGENIYLDTSMGFSFYGSETFLRIAKGHGTDKLLFGSDAPWSDAKSELAAFRALPLTDDEKDAILYKNALQIL